MVALGFFHLLTKKVLYYLLFLIYLYLSNLCHEILEYAYVQITMYSQFFNEDEGAKFFESTS